MVKKTFFSYLMISSKQSEIDQRRARTRTNYSIKNKIISDMNKNIFLFLTSLFFLFGTTATAQGWERLITDFEDSNTQEARRVLPADNDNYHVLLTGGENILAKIGNFGIVQSSSIFAPNQSAINMIATANDELVVLSQIVDPATNTASINFFRFDTDYNLLVETNIDLQQPRGIAKSDNGEFWLTGLNENFPASSFLQKLDAQGQPIGQPVYDGFEYYYPTKILPQTNGGAWVFGYAKINNVGPYKTIINEFDNTGNLTNQIIFGNPSSQLLPRDAIQTSDGGLLIVAFSGQSITTLIKMGSNGVEEWREDYSSTNFLSPMKIGEKADGSGYRLLYRESIAANESAGIAEIDLLGNWLNKQEFATDYVNLGQDLLLLPNNEAVIAGYRNRRAGSIFVGENYLPYLIHLDLSGNSLESAISGTASNDDNEDCLADGINLAIGRRVTAFQNGYSMASTTVDSMGNYFLPTNAGNYKLAVELPNFLWSSCQDSLDIVLPSVDTVNNQAFVVAYNNEPMDSISGYVFQDYDQDCLRDSFETVGYGSWNVFLTLYEDGNNETFQETTDTTGYFSFTNLTGFTNGANALVYFEAPIGTGLNCEFPCIQEIELGPFIGTDFTVNNGVSCDTLPFCPIMDVYLATDEIRPCMEEEYHINYCNIGGETTEDAYLEFTLDEALIFNGSSIPWTVQNGNIYTFELGDLLSNQCGGIVIDFFTPCDIEVGATFCSEVYAYPDSTCFSADEEWDESEIKLSVDCLGDSVKFNIENIGIGDMLTPLEYIVIEDNVLLHSQQIFQLPAGGIMERTYPVNGSFYRMEAMQSVGFPGFDTPITWIEGCGATGNFEFGIVNQYPLGDEDSWHDIFCLESTNSYDPNDKNGYPLGVGDQNFIDQNEPLEYLIRFQNTGTADALVVEIRDTLAVDLLSALTVRPGAASHAYTWDMEGNGVVVFRFENINLSAELFDEEGSKGFVQFTIEQAHDLPIGTEINNTAAIYFDNNAPIITNETLHTIGDDYLSTWLREIPKNQLQEVTVFPNPANDFISINVEGLDNQEVLQFELYDVLGKQVMNVSFENRDADIELNALATGSYYFKIYQDEVVVGVGKVLRF
ncbi:MAG: hypothetical protein ACI9LN_002385 [Saprospiraceae bacterium]|jgi:hypothetical protein